MDNPIPVDLGRIAQDLQIRRVQVESVVQLLDEGNTVPFITRYRKERTGNLNEVTIREIQLRVQRLRELAERKETILKAIEAQGKLDPELAAAIRSADNPKRLEDLYLPFKPKKRTKASDARERGLEPLALRVWTRDETLTDLESAAAEFLNPESGVDSVEKVLEGVGHILAEAISEMATVRDAVRKVVWRTGKIVTSKGEIPEGQGLDYRDYFDYTEPVSQIPPHRVLAINRGDKEGPLKVKLEVSRPDVEASLFGQLPLEAHPQHDLFHAAAIDALDRLILPSMEREVRRDLTEAAEKHAVEVFARNLGSLLLQPPIPKQVVMAIDPGFKSGCKVAVLDPSGQLLDQVVIYPHPPANRRSEAKIALKDLVGKHGVGVVAIGNGTACRETEELIAEIIAEGTRFSQGESFPAESVEAPSELGWSDSSESAEPTASAESPQAEGAAPVIEAASERTPAEPEGAPEEDIAEAVTGNGDGINAHVEVEEEPQAATSSESPVEMLPPITGGAPEPGEEAVEPASLGEGPPPVSALATGTLDSGAHAAPAGDDASAESGPAPEVEAPSAEPFTVPDDWESAEPAVAESSIAEAVSAEAIAEEQAESGPVETPTTSDHLPTSADSSEAQHGETGAAPAAPPPAASGRPPRQGKSERGRGRGKGPAGPPPPQLPPQPHPADAQLSHLAYVIVNEAGASVYSTSQVGREELAEHDATLRSTISIGRRLQDPLSELVKIEPQNIGVGLYQHDVNPKQLKETLEAVIASCVNFVGVDLNTASVSLLRHVSGLNQLTARRIFDYRKDNGPFARREQLMQVEGVGPATFTQAAGFLKVTDGEDPLDRTWIHPESYEAATRLLERFGYATDVVRDKTRLPELQAKLAETDIAALAVELGLGEFTLRDIIEALGRPERDPRDDLPKPIFKKGVLKLEDLAAGMELKGTVLNVVDFGAFVDIGLKDSGLVHISQLANRYVKSPHDVVSVGDVVTVWVMGVDQERKRVSLTMVKPGTERNRGPQGGGGRRGGEPRDPNREQARGQGRRGGGRGPRPPGSALTSPPVGAPPVSTLAEAPARRPDRGPSPSGPRGHDAAPGRTGHGRPSGPRGGSYGQGGGGPQRGDRDRGPTPRPAPRPSRPSAPPAPLSKDALAGNVPLRTFGQLKQLWEARTEGPESPVTSETPHSNEQTHPTQNPEILGHQGEEASPGAE